MRERRKMPKGGRIQSILGLLIESTVNLFNDLLGTRNVSKAEVKDDSNDDKVDDLKGDQVVDTNIT